MTPNEFFHAVYKGDHPGVLRGLREGLNPNDTNREGSPALFFAVEGGHELVLALLLEAGANPLALDHRMRSAVHIAAYWNRISILDELELVGSPTDVQALGDHLATPMHYAAQRGHREAVLWLLDRGANPDRCLYDGQKPIDLAQKNGHHAVVELLTRWSLQTSGAIPAKVRSI